MKLLPGLAVLAAAVFLAGCDSVSEATASVRARLAAHAQPRLHVFTADPRATYEAAKVAVNQMNFRFVRGGAAQGRLEAVSAVAPSDNLNGSRQITLSARFSNHLEGGTEVSLLLEEVIEGNSSQRAGQATAAPLRDTPLYEVFFRSVQQVLERRPVT